MPGPNSRYSRLRGAAEDIESEFTDRDRVETDPWYSGEDISISYVTVEIIPADSTDILTDILSEYGLVTHPVELGERGFRATLRPVEDYVDRIETDSREETSEEVLDSVGN